TTFLSIPVEGLRAVTVTSGTTAPVGSETTPEMLPVSLAQSIETKTKVKVRNSNVRFDMGCPPSEISKPPHPLIRKRKPFRDSTAYRNGTDSTFPQKSRQVSSMLCQIRRGTATIGKRCAGR